MLQNLYKNTFPKHKSSIINATHYAIGCLSVDTAILDPNRTFDQEHPKTLTYFHFIQAMINNKMLHNQLFPSNLVNNTYQFCLINTTDCTTAAQKSHSFM